MDEPFKVCCICHESKLLSAFGKDSHLPGGLRSSCRVCHNKKNKEWADKNREQVYLATRSWYNKNIQRTRDVGKIWRDNNKGKKREQIKKWQENNPEKWRAMQRKGSKKRRSTMSGKISDAFSSAIYRSLRSGKSGKHWEEIVGYSVEQLKEHIEKQFEPWMSWGNYGKFTWHIDHILPVSSFNYDSTESEDFKKCWALKNLRPLRAKENHSKGSKIIYGDILNATR